MDSTELIARTLISDLKRDFGLTNAQAAGVVGNLMHESAGFGTLQEVNPLVPGSAGGYGYAQWTGARRKSFEAYVEEKGLDPASYDANYGFLKHELATNPYERRQFEKVRGAGTTDEAAQIFSDNFLRPGIPHMDSRKASAATALSYAAKPIPPGELPSVATARSTVPESTAARVNRMFDRPTPAPRAQGIAARTNAMFDREAEIAATPLPRARPERDPTASQPVSRPSGGFEYAPNGQPRDPDNGFLMASTDPRYAQAIASSPNPPARVQARLPELAPPSSAPGLSARVSPPVPPPPNRTATAQPASSPVPSGGYAGQDRATSATGVTRAPGIAGSVQMTPGARPAVANQLVSQAEATQQRTIAPPSSGGYAGQDAARPAPKPVAAPSSVAAPMPEKYIVTYEKKEIPLGEVAHKYSRDAVARQAEGQKVADRMQTINRKVTTLNPDWVAAQAAAGAKPAPPKPVSKPTAPKPAGQEENLGQQIVGGVRQAVGLPREGLGPGLVGGIRTAIGLPADGIGPGIQRGLQRIFNGGPQQVAPPPATPTGSYRTPQGYTDEGNGKIVSNETGGVYYARHLSNLRD